MLPVRYTIIALAASAMAVIAFMVLAIIDILRPSPSVIVPFWIILIAIVAATLLLRALNGTGRTPRQVNEAPLDALELPVNPTQVDPSPIEEPIAINDMQAIKEQLNRIEQRETDILQEINALSIAGQNPPPPPKIDEPQPVADPPLNSEIAKQADTSAPPTPPPVEAASTAPPASSSAPISPPENPVQADPETSVEPPAPKEIEEVGDEEYVEKMDMYTQQLAQIKRDLSQLRSGLLDKIEDLYGEGKNKKTDDIF